MVSIIILNYNTFNLTIKCIRSVFDNTKNVDFEIILVDNASTECDPEKFLEEFPGIVLIKNSENRGFSKGCNDGIAKASGKYILLLNSDTILLNNAIGFCYDYLNSNPDTGVCTCRIENPDGSPQNNCQRFPSITYPLVERLRLHKIFSKRKQGKILLGPYFNYSEQTDCDWVWGTFFMFPLKTLELFPEKILTETFWMYLEDMEWCKLISKAGKKICFLPDGRILHFGGNNFEVLNLDNKHRNNFEIFLKNYYNPLHRFIIRQLS